MKPNLTARVAELERRLDDLEHSAPPAASVPDARGTVWALEALRERQPPGGAVLVTGTVALPDGEAYEWQETRASGDLLDDDWTERAGAFAALAHPVRLAILRAVVLGARTVPDLKELPGMGTSGQTYHHLRLLLNSGWLRSAGRGRYVVPPERVVPLLAAYAAVAR